MPRTSIITTTGLSLDLYSLQGLSMNTNINSSSSIQDPTSLYNMKVGELIKEGLGHMLYKAGEARFFGCYNNKQTNQNMNLKKSIFFLIYTCL